MDTEVRCTSDGIQLGEEPSCMEICWDEITEISMYQIDAIETEIVYLCFLHSSGHYLEITDSTTGWNDLLDVLPSKLNSISNDLRELIHQLSVDDNPVIIYKT